MIIKNYTKNKGKISYTIDVDGFEFPMVHRLVESGHVAMSDTDDFLERVAEFDEHEADIIEQFIDLQTDCLMYGVEFEFI